MAAAMTISVTPKFIATSKPVNENTIAGTQMQWISRLRGFW
jgi:hypothetical protein